MNRQISLRYLALAFATASQFLASNATAQSIPQKWAGIQTSGWTERGPAGLGAYVTTLLTHPTNASILYAGTPRGGIWKTTDGGANWQSLTNGSFPSLTISCLAMDPSNPNIIYAGTGDRFTYAQDSGELAGAGIYKTTDGGATWTRLVSSTNTGLSVWKYIHDIAVSPTNPQLVIVATQGESGQVNDRGIGRSTDGGATWSFTPVDTQLYDVDFHPTDGNKAIVGGRMTVNGGLTWTTLPLDADGILSVAFAPSNPNIIYAVHWSGEESVLSASLDGGQSFTQRSDPQVVDLNAGTSSMRPILWVDPTNANNLLAGIDPLWRSTDGGFTWTDVATGGPALHLHAVEANNFASSRRVYLSGAGGVYRTDNVLTMGPGNPLVQIGGGIRNASLIRGAAHGNTGRSLTLAVNGDTWLDRNTGFNWVKGETVEFDAAYPGEGHIFDDPAAEADGKFSMYSLDTVSVIRHRFNADGSFFGTVHFPTPSQDQLSVFHVDPNNKNAFYAGGGAVWRATNIRGSSSGVANWTQVKAAQPDTRVVSIAVRPGNSNEMWVLEVNGGLYKTLNATASAPTWTQIENSPPIFQIWLDGGSVIYGLAGGVWDVDDDSIWKSTNGGATWTQLTGFGKDHKVNDLIVHPTIPNRLYVATRRGVVASENGGEAWSPWALGPINGEVTDLFFDGQKLLATTLGRGLFSILPDAARMPEVTLTSPTQDALLVSPASITATATASDPDGMVTRVEFYANGALIGSDTTAPYSVNWNTPPAGSHSISAVATDNSGLKTLSRTTTIKVVAGITSRRTAIADAHVRGGGSATTNFGTATVLEVKTNPLQLQNSRDTYLKFSLSGLTGLAHQVRLRVTGNLNTTGTAVAGVLGVADSSWAENTITWNNRPALGSILSSLPVSGGAATTYVFDVTGYVRQARAAGATSVTLALHMRDTTDPHFRVNSRENTMGKPELEFVLAPENVLLVVGNTALNSGDTAIRDRLQRMGYTVTTKAATAATTADANGKSLVYISSTVTSGNVNTKFRDTATPVFNCEPAIQDDLMMTGPNPLFHYGTLGSQFELELEGFGHPMHAGLLGSFESVTSPASTFVWGVPHHNAIRIAFAADNSRSKTLIYGYEKGMEMWGLYAPARRVQFFLSDTTATTLNATGWSLFDAAIYWAADN